MITIDDDAQILKTSEPASQGCLTAGRELLRTESVGKVYRTRWHRDVAALDDVSISIRAGDCVALCGPSGSGKSTLLGILGALERPSSGRTFFAGEDLTGYSDVQLARVRRQVGFVFQDFGLIRQLPAWENITYPLIPRGWNAAARQDRARALLEQVGLGDRFYQLPTEMSSGEQQRVALARALAGEPTVLLADEPTSSLDAAAARQLIGHLEALRASGMTIVFASHDPVLLECLQRRYTLSQGRLTHV